MVLGQFEPVLSNCKREHTKWMRGMWKVRQTCQKRTKYYQFWIMVFLRSLKNTDLAISQLLTFKPLFGMAPMPRWGSEDWYAFR